MRLTPTERDRLLIFSAAELARARRSRGLQLNVPEATALVSDAVIEAARDGKRLAEALEIGRGILGPEDVLPGVADVVGDIWVEAVFDDGTRLAVVSEPFGPTGADAAPGALLHDGSPVTPDYGDLVAVSVTNTAGVPISVTSHFHFFEVNPRLKFDRAAAFGMRLAIDAGRRSVTFDPGATVNGGGTRLAAHAWSLASPDSSTGRSTPPAQRRRHWHEPVPGATSTPGRRPKHEPRRLGGGLRADHR